MKATPSYPAFQPFAFFNPSQFIQTKAVMPQPDYLPLRQMKAQMVQQHRMEQLYRKSLSDDISAVADWMYTTLLIVGCFFTAFDLVIYAFNFSTFIYLLKRPDTFIICIIAFFGLSLLFKLFGMGLAFYESCGKPTARSSTCLYILVGTVLAHAIGFVWFMSWSWSNLSIGTNIGLIVDLVFYVVTAIFVIMIECQLPEPKRFEYAMIEEVSID